MNDVGFYGKLACRGDFVSRGLPTSFIQPWDQWLAAGIQASQRQLGEQWLQAYLVSPLWRFALAPGVCGPQAVVGVLMPSIDRVGRYFPLTVAQVLEPGQRLAAAVGGGEAWFEEVEATLLATLEPDADFDAFAAALQPFRDTRPLPQAMPARLTVGGLQRLDATTPEGRALALAECACEGMSLWWGRGSERIAPGLMRCAGLPRSEDFAGFLLGSEADFG
ncbi:type VI secretion system-associated protein TagF [Pseudomonas sp. S 311-6]|uniref:type VI secretion system-associated protein TagF n=1 Tax=Pseudomonas TaxID=286 RepID=UPI001CE40799|nr:MULTISPECIES: type VI secretion system-associated protein TagF [Pseudomonas]MCO7639658.1 type VI secretion system-associated protein TagF [Pseudomonas sp. S 311-6]MCO7565200.1 type VI secretion system-associated protein TagF [Pseudomonas mosselii]MCO7593542.1 type VI secretion system-associated protein TagF [Pseudomonas guariconensis]MCO7616438.1 type VI secretion system-associated protein TagF [Pseudomonas guariconensis]MCO7630586.1 type VI secretion system-associated protein TagF [Pseudom